MLESNMTNRLTGAKKKTNWHVSDTSCMRTKSFLSVRHQNKEENKKWLNKQDGNSLKKQSDAPIIILVCATRELRIIQTGEQP